MTFIMYQYAPARTVWNSAWLKHWLWTLKCVLLQECMRHCQICRVPRYTWLYHMEEITGTLLYIYWSYYYVSIELSGWKGSVSYGLGADISLPHCLATGIWTLAHPKKRPPGRNLGEHRSVRRSGTVSRGTVVLPLCLRMRSQLRAKVIIFVGKKYPPKWLEIA